MPTRSTARWREPREDSSVGRVRRRLLGTPRLNFNKNVDQRDRRRGYAGNAAGLPDRARTDAQQFFFHLPRQAADGSVVEPVGNVALLRLLQPLDRLLLL